MINPGITQLNFDKFIENRFREGEKAMILLAGKRDVREQDKEKLIALGKKLAELLPQATFRSGNAKGADELFAQGISSVAPERLQVVVPYSGHRAAKNSAYTTYDLGDIPLAQEPAVIYNSKHNKKTKDLVDRYVKGEKSRYTQKVLYIIRDTIMVIGSKSGIPKATFAIFYDDLAKPKSGGTGHTMDICHRNYVKYIDQGVWFDWVEND